MRKIENRPIQSGELETFVTVLVGVTSLISGASFASEIIVWSFAEITDMFHYESSGNTTASSMVGTFFHLLVGAWLMFRAKRFQR